MLYSIRININIRCHKSNNVISNITSFRKLRTYELVRINKKRMDLVKFSQEVILKIKQNFLKKCLGHLLAKQCTLHFALTKLCKNSMAMVAHFCSYVPPLTKVTDKLISVIKNSHTFALKHLSFLVWTLTVVYFSLCCYHIDQSQRLNNLIKSICPCFFMWIVSLISTNWSLATQ